LNDTDQNDSYREGYRAAMADVARRAAAFPAPRPELIRCRECQQYMEIGQPAVSIGGDAYGNRMWVHGECPPEDMAPALLVVPDAPMPPGQTTAVHSLRDALDNKEPGAGMAALAPYRVPSGIQVGHATAVTRPDGSSHFILSDFPAYIPGEDQEDQEDQEEDQEEEGEPMFFPIVGWDMLLFKKYGQPTEEDQ
jgi:hypothetical protein